MNCPICNLTLDTVNHGNSILITFCNAEHFYIKIEPKKAFLFISNDKNSVEFEYHSIKSIKSTTIITDLINKEEINLNFFNPDISNPQSIFDKINKDIFSLLYIPCPICNKSFALTSYSNLIFLTCDKDKIDLSISKNHASLKINIKGAHIEFNIKEDNNSLTVNNTQIEFFYPDLNNIPIIFNLVDRIYKMKAFK